MNLSGSGRRKNVFLIGYRCCGKTSVGRILAQSLGWRFVDGDQVLESESGQSVAQIVAGQGWEGFRRREKEMMRRLTRLERHVVATGGGVILDEENVRMMRESGAVVWLSAAIPTICERMGRDANTGSRRPALTRFGGPVEEVAAVLRVREPLYRSAAHFLVATDGVDPGSVCEKIMERAGGLAEGPRIGREGE